MEKVESVWDYPRPPRLEPFNGSIRIVHGGKQVANTQAAYRILETSHPPTYYIPMGDIDTALIRLNQHRSFCEFKGTANYVDLAMNGTIIHNVGWYYENPTKPYKALARHMAFYASRLEDCFVNEEKVKTQEGDFYGGWITGNIKGPFKGGPGTGGW